MDLIQQIEECERIELFNESFTDNYEKKWSLVHPIFFNFFRVIDPSTLATEAHQSLVIYKSKTTWIVVSIEI